MVPEIDRKAAKQSARELLRDPHWPLHADDDLGGKKAIWPAQYQRATHRDQPIHESDLRD